MAGKNNILITSIIAIIVLLVMYYVRMYAMSPHIFSFQFSPTRVEQYLKSQDITRHVKGRVYLSDEDIHMATGYLYVYGADPTAFNFQHPPLVKYLYGIAIRLFGNPYIVQLFFGSSLLVLTYIAALLSTKKQWVAFIASTFLIMDPVFADLSQHLLLDLGQAVFAMAYILAHIFMPHAFVVHGLLLGAFAASKFWSTTLFFIIAAAAYRLLKKTWHPRQFGLHIAIAFVTFSVVYAHSFFTHVPFNIVFFQLKTLKYWLQHSVSSVPGDSFLLFFTGQHHMWWQQNELTRAIGWSLLWPISSFSLLLSMYIYRNKVSPLLFMSSVPLAYVAYISFQAPYMRYFILILPYCYIILCNSISLILRSKK